MIFQASPRLIVLLPLVLPLILAACDRPQQKPEAENPVTPEESLPVSAMDFSTDYLCPDGNLVTVNYRDNHVIVQFPGEQLTLSQTISASGARYSDEATTVWNKGRDLLIEQPGQEQRTCHEVDAKTASDHKAEASTNQP